MDTRKSWSARHPIVSGLMKGFGFGLLLIMAVYISAVGKIVDKTTVVFDADFKVVNTAQPGQFFVRLPATWVEYYESEDSSSSVAHTFGTFQDHKGVEYSSTAAIHLTFNLQQATEYINSLPEDERVSLAINAQYGEVSLPHAVVEHARIRIQEGYFQGELENIHFEWASTSESQVPAIAEQYKNQRPPEDRSDEYDFFCGTVSSKIDAEYYEAAIQSYLGMPEGGFEVEIDSLHVQQFKTELPCDLKGPDAPRPQPTPDTPVPSAPPSAPEGWLASAT